MTRKQTIGLIILLSFFSLFIFIININDFIYLKSSNYTDIAISHFPNLLLIQQSIIRDHQIPLWSNLIQSGYPFAANPLSGIWYLFGWIAVIFPLPMGININLAIHVLFTFIGMILFLREEKRSYPAAVFGALAFSISTRMFSHLGAGHLTLIYAVSWTPWLLLVTKRYSGSPLWYKKLFPGIIFGFIFTADPRWILPAGLIWFFYLFKIFRKFKPVFQLSIYSFFTGLITSAGSWMPLIQYIPLSTRALLTDQEKLIYSLNFDNLIGFFIPDIGGLSEWVVYPGALALLLFVLGIFIYKENKTIRFWYYVATAGLILSFGSNLPFVNLIFSLPIISLLRVPSRFMWIFFLAIAVIGSFVFDKLVFQRINYKFDRIFFITPVLAFVVLLTAGVVFVTGKLSINLIWSGLFFIISYSLIAVVYHKNGKPLLYSLLFIGILFIDLIGINIQSLNFRPSREVLAVAPGLEDILANLPSYGRIYTPSYSVTQEQAASLGIAQVNGIDPMQLSGYENYFAQASGIPINQYTVTLPPFNDGDPHSDNEKFCPDSGLLQKLNVMYVLSNFKFINCSGWSNFQTVEDIFVYQIKNLPLAYQIGDSDLSVDVLEYTPNRINLKTFGSGTMVLSEVNYPGWIAYIDGKKTSVLSEGIFRAIDLPNGEHAVELLFRPLPVYLGASIQFIGLISFLILFLERNN